MPSLVLPRGVDKMSTRKMYPPCFLLLNLIIVFSSWQCASSVLPPLPSRSVTSLPTEIQKEGKATQYDLSASAGQMVVPFPERRAHRSENVFASFIDEFIITLRHAKDHLIAGAIARGCSIFLLYPLDTIKTRLQMSPSLRDALPSITSLSLFNGVLGSLAGQIPYGMLTFGSYEVYKTNLISALPDVPHTALYMLAAILGDLSGSFWLCPSEMIKQSLQGGVYANIFDATSSVLKTQGIGGFYRGFLSQIMRDVPFRAVQMPSYEVVKQLYSQHFATDDEGCTRPLRPVENMLVGVIAGSFAAALTTPLDVIKTRYMTEKVGVSFWKVGWNIIEKEGIGGIFSGLGPRVVYVGPSCGIFFLIYEASKLHLASIKTSKIVTSSSSPSSSLTSSSSSLPTAPSLTSSTSNAENKFTHGTKKTQKRIRR